jgi:hypothetical protein
VISEENLGSDFATALEQEQRAAISESLCLWKADENRLASGGDTSWVSVNRSLPLLQASSFGNYYWQPVYAINQSTSRIFDRDPVAMASM